MFVFLAMILLGFYHRVFVVYEMYEELYHWRMIVLGFAQDVVFAGFVSLFLLPALQIKRLKGLASKILWSMILLSWCTLSYLNHTYVSVFHKLLPISWFSEVRHNASSPEALGILLQEVLTIDFVLLFFLPLGIGALGFLRKGFFESRLRWSIPGIIIISSFANSITLDPVIQLDSSSHPQNHLLRYWYYDDGQKEKKRKRFKLSRIESLKNMFARDRQQEDLLLPKVSGKPNVLLIQLENFRAFEIGAYGSQLELSPNFDSFRKKGVLFTSIYSSGVLTAQGQWSLLCGSHTLPGLGGVFRDVPLVPVQCLPEVLQNNGYDTWWFHNQSGAYDKQAFFLKNHGIRHIRDRLSFPYGSEVLGWGISDRELFKHVNRHLSQAEEPFFLYIQTQTNHHPYAVPKEFERKHDVSGTLGKFYNSFFYTDFYLGWFLKSYLKTPRGQRSFIIVTADHGNGMALSERERIDQKDSLQKFKIPLLFIYPAGYHSTHNQEIDVLGGQTDLLPTLLDLFDFATDKTFLGRSLVRPLEDRYVFHEEKMYLRPSRGLVRVSAETGGSPGGGSANPWRRLEDEILSLQSWIVEQSDRSSIVRKLGEFELH